MSKLNNLSTCSICIGKIEVTELVTTNCGHWFCKDCFWEWCKQNNKCPNCRAVLMEKDREEELSMVRLLDRRREIVVENEQLREEKKELVRRLIKLKITQKRRKARLQKQFKEIEENKVILKEINMWKINPRLAKEMQEKRLKKLGLKIAAVQKVKKRFMLKQLQMRVGGGMTINEICGLHYNRSHPGDSWYGGVIIFKWGYDGCEEKGWRTLDVSEEIYDKIKK